MIEFGDPAVGIEPWIVIATATLLAPVVFLATVVAAVIRRSSTGAVGPRFGALVAFTGGLVLGTLLLMEGDPTVRLPILGAAALLVYGQWRRRRRALAGWLLAGTSLPWTILWAYYLALLAGGAPFDPVTTSGWFAVGAVALAAGGVLAWRGDPIPPPPSPEAPAGQPGSRAFGSIAAAIRDPALIGPFGQPEIAMLVSFIAVLMVVPLLIPPSVSVIVRIGLPSIIASVLATEVYVRAMPSRSRRAFEAFSWLGERELARFRRETGGSPPTSPEAAGRWLATHPAGPRGSDLRVEVLLLAGRIDEARAEAERMPRTTAAERFDQAACTDLVEWRAGATGAEADAALAAMERRAAEIEPVDGDARLLAEVAVATAKVRRLMADGRASAGDAGRPLLEVRERLGHRADGQVGRALRPRLLPLLLLGSLAMGFVLELAGTLRA